MTDPAERPGGLGSIELEGPDGRGEVEDVEIVADAAIRRARRRLLADLLRPHRRPIALAALGVLLSTAGQLSIGYLLKPVIDKAVLPRDRQALAVVLVLFGVAIAADALGQRISIALVGRVAERAVFALRARLWRHMAELSIDWFERNRTGRVVARATSDVEAVYELFSQAALTLVGSVLLMGGIAVVVFILDPVLAAVVVCVIPLLVAASWVFKGRSEVAYRTVREKIALVLVSLAENLSGIKVVQAFNRERHNESLFADVNRQHLAANTETIRLMSLYGPGVELLGWLAIVLVLLVGGFRVLDGATSLGVLTAFVFFVRQFFDPLQELSQYFNSVQAAFAGLEKIAGVLQERSSVPERRDAIPLRVKPVKLVNTEAGVRGAEVRLEGVTFSYSSDGRAPALQDVDLTIGAGETLALVGATGAGKSTIAKLVARFYDPGSGRVTIDGRDLREVTTASLRAHVAIVPQEAFLFGGSVFDNIALGRPGVGPAEVEEAAAAVGAHAFIASLPAAYDTPLERHGSRLSGGQRQLVSFARAWVSDPAVLILDEATSALDLPSERLIQRALVSLLADRTALVIAHRLSSIDIADRIALVDGGRIVELGTAAELLSAGTRFRALHERWEATVR